MIDDDDGSSSDQVMMAPDSSSDKRPVIKSNMSNTLSPKVIILRFIKAVNHGGGRGHRAVGGAIKNLQGGNKSVMFIEDSKIRGDQLEECVCFCVCLLSL